MKKLLLLALTAVIMAGCEKIMDTDYYTGEGFRVCTIDSCEYIHLSNGNGAYYTHKGNCKYCVERRKQEIRELIQELKDE